MNFRFKPLVFFIMLAIANPFATVSFAQEITDPGDTPTVPDPAPEPIPEPIPEPTPEPTPEPIPEPTPEPTPEPVPEPTPLPELPTSTPYPDDKINQLPDYGNAHGNNVTFTGPGSLPGPSYTTDENGINPGEVGYIPTVSYQNIPDPTLNIGLGDQNTVINWNGHGFDVGADATVNFNPSQSNSAVLNYDKSGTMSVVDGAVNANGAKLFLVNPNGISDKSGSFSGLFSNEYDNVQLLSNGKLRLKTQGNRVYGPVTGTVDTTKDLTSF